jgi:hypothetical protein
MTLLSGLSRRGPRGRVESKPMKVAVTISEFIDRRKANVKLVVFPLWLLGFVMVAWGGKHGPWTPVTSIGVGVALVAGTVYLAFVATIRCPRCRRFIGLTTVSLRRDSPQPECCVHCGLSFREPMGRPRR